MKRVRFKEIPAGIMQTFINVYERMSELNMDANFKTLVR